MTSIFDNLTLQDLVGHPGKLRKSDCVRRDGKIGIIVFSIPESKRNRNSEELVYFPKRRRSRQEV